MHTVEESSETLSFATEPVIASLANVLAYQVSTNQIECLPADDGAQNKQKQFPLPPSHLRRAKGKWQGVGGDSMNGFSQCHFTVLRSLRVGRYCHISYIGANAWTDGWDSAVFSTGRIGKYLWRETT